jgi:hypothetical protein
VLPVLPLVLLFVRAVAANQALTGIDAMQVEVWLVWQLLFVLPCLLLLLLLLLRLQLLCAMLRLMRNQHQHGGQEPQQQQEQQQRAAPWHLCRAPWQLLVC